MVIEVTSGVLYFMQDFRNYNALSYTHVNQFKDWVDWCVSAGWGVGRVFDTVKETVSRISLLGVGVSVKVRSLGFNLLSPFSQSQIP